jgi:hypothetical protein
LGKVNEGTIQSQKSKVNVDAHACPNFRLHTYGAAATKQYYAHYNSSVGSRSWWNSIFAHEFF